MRSKIAADHENGRSTLNVAIKPSRRGRKPRPVEEFPKALTLDWIDPNEFRDALALHMERHGDSTHHLCRAITDSGHRIDYATIRTWLRDDWTETEGHFTSGAKAAGLAPARRL